MNVNFKNAKKVVCVTHFLDGLTFGKVYDIVDINFRYPTNDDQYFIII